ncbi:MAG: peptidoglycan DD-metalloendopeptidase family protein [Chitinophagaceae bacterium]|nr:peptidoglycan DD-metalloendopeptidase family protein [Chitinophagaceae bacterium]
MKDPLIDPKDIIHVLRKNQSSFFPVVPFNPEKDKLKLVDFTSTNTDLTSEIFDNTELFSEYIMDLLEDAGATYGIGGYGELRTVYSRSKIFDAADIQSEPRRLHLGIDIWGKAGTPVYAPFGGMVHSFAFNDHYGDYGATLILLHQLEGFSFYTLYGHLSLNDIQRATEGQYVNRGQQMAVFGPPEENGHWPPHLHFQVILDMAYREGDYPGVCKYSEREQYLANSPDADIILQMMQYAR